MGSNIELMQHNFAFIAQSTPFISICIQIFEFRLEIERSLMCKGLSVNINIGTKFEFSCLIHFNNFQKKKINQNSSKN